MAGLTWSAAVPDVVAGDPTLAQPYTASPCCDGGEHAGPAHRDASGCARSVRGGAVLRGLDDHSGHLGALGGGGSQDGRAGARGVDRADHRRHLPCAVQGAAAWNCDGGTVFGPVMLAWFVAIGACRVGGIKPSDGDGASTEMAHVVLRRRAGPAAAHSDLIDDHPAGSLTYAAVSAPGRGCHARRGTARRGPCAAHRGHRHRVQNGCMSALWSSANGRWLAIPDVSQAGSGESCARPCSHQIARWLRDRQDLARRAGSHADSRPCPYPTPAPWHRHPADGLDPSGWLAIRSVAGCPDGPPTR